MKLQAITLAAFLAVASTDVVVDAKQGGVRKNTKEEHAAHKKRTNQHAAAHSTAKRELGKKNKCDVPIFPTECDGGDLQPTWVGVKGEVCLSAGNSLCRKSHNWQFGVTAPMPPGMDADDMNGNGGNGKDPIPGPAMWGPIPGYKVNNGGRRELGKKKWNGKAQPSGAYWYNGQAALLPAGILGTPVNLPEPPLPYNVTDASAHLWRGSDCDPVWSFPRPASDVCIGMVGKDDFTNSTFAASSYMTFKNSTYTNTTTTPNTVIDGDWWFIFHPLIGGDWKTMPRLKLDPSIKDGIVMKFKRGPDGKDNEDLLMAIDKDGDIFFNPYGEAYFAPNGDRSQAFGPVPLEAVFPPTTIMDQKTMKALGLI